MNLKQEYPNFNASLLFYIEDKNPVLASNDSKLLSYFIPLRNFKKGFDYYELVPVQSGGVYFRIVTMLGLKKVVETASEVFTNDLNPNDWSDLIFNLTTTHFSKEEYVALKHGYVKKSPNGCALFLVLIIGLSTLIYISISF